MAKFSELGLKEELQEAVAELGFEQPTPIQEEVIPTLLTEELDLVGLAQTGTGKTAAFGLPLLHRVDVSDKRTQGLILCPVRELGLQIAKDLENFAKKIPGLRIVAVYGGSPIDQQIRQLNRGAHIIVATPGRMHDLIRRNKTDISAVETVVLDEADEMLKMGFKDELDAILDETPEDKNVWLFSATMPREVARIASNYMTDPKEVTVGTKNTGNKNVKHYCYMVRASDRYEALKRVVDYNPNVYGIVFCRTRQETKDVAERLMQDGYNADALHGDLSQAQRDYVMGKFRQRTLQLLIATDVAARGLDVNDLSHVINYNLPDDIETYNHRSGRTGRAGRDGTSIAIVHMREKHRLRAIERVIKQTFITDPIPSGPQICERQLFHLVDRMHSVEMVEEEIEQYLPKVYEKLEDLSREEIVNRFVALEFNRFLDYYRGARDLNANDRRDNSNSRERGENNRRSAESGYTRFFINLGKRDEVSPKELIELINKGVKGDRIDIGRIDLKQNFSFFEVGEGRDQDVISGMGSLEYNGRKIDVEVSNGAGGGGGRRGGGDRRRGGFSGGGGGRRGGGGYGGGDRRGGGGDRRRGGYGGGGGDRDRRGNGGGGGRRKYNKD
ncbi:DEAD/DEAH box helicase [Flammeovirga kamogawensis]|uniref:DEAD/DEAH box helicase n=1 Tax=Flammeovirga kamogawensis TaxID=373891 RepID=A0ABX8GV34_9BACT|nr:DEAD/DEAH box helicase [Flammeovirga kamogawensis]MBB6462462.1 ATP-dependent RNA helicase DeaD [Flammeovirga kamogawensis]QWG06800.1 DEAD/DEAH box helicase [Flammeovirga kamogawensis]TRX68623.1 DEAD/DEAH box helicase [Flammeovirga kamogawensis]